MNRRRRKTEKEEDEEILKDESGEQEDAILTVFTESPSCKLSYTSNKDKLVLVWY